jgi:nucleotide-binding universal stress UspA family protein
MKVLLAVDGSTYSKRMLAYLAAHNELLGSDHEFTALTVLPALATEAEIYADPVLVHRTHLEKAESILRPVRAFAEQKKWKLDVLVLEGDPARTIAQHAEGGGYDLLVMGSHGHGALAGLILGSVAMRVLAQCRTPVLLIR